MQLVRAGLRHNCQYAARRAAVLGLVVLRLNLEFLDVFDREVLQGAANRVVGVVSAIHDVVDVTAVASVEGDDQLPGFGRIGVVPE